MEIEFTALAPRDAGRRAFPAGATRSNARLARSARLGLRHDPMPRPKDVVCGRQRETMDERLVRRDRLRRLQALEVAPRKMCRRRGTSSGGRSRAASSLRSKPTNLLDSRDFASRSVAAG